MVHKGASKQLKIRSLTGPEKLKVCAHICIADLLPALPTDETARIHLWTELLHLNQFLSKPANELSSQSIEEYERRAHQWGATSLTYIKLRMSPLLFTL